MSLQTYVVYKFFIPDYAIQSRQIPIEAREVNEYGFKYALWKARDIFLSLGLKPTGDIHDSHEQLWHEGRITHSAKIRRLTPKQVARMKKGKEPRKKIGWKRRYRRRR